MKRQLTHSERQYLYLVADAEIRRRGPAYEHAILQQHGLTRERFRGWQRRTRSKALPSDQKMADLIQPYHLPKAELPAPVEAPQRPVADTTSSHMVFNASSTEDWDLM